jgi:hypothetical protein
MPTGTATAGSRRVLTAIAMRIVLSYPTFVQVGPSFARNVGVPIGATISG